MLNREVQNKRSHFAGGVLTPPLTKGDATAPFGNPTILFPPQEAELTQNASLEHAEKICEHLMTSVDNADHPFE